MAVCANGSCTCSFGQQGSISGSREFGSRGSKFSWYVTRTYNGGRDGSYSYFQRRSAPYPSKPLQNKPSYLALQSKFTQCIANSQRPFCDFTASRMIFSMSQGAIQPPPVPLSGQICSFTIELMRSHLLCECFGISLHHVRLLTAPIDTNETKNKHILHCILRRMLGSKRTCKNHKLSNPTDHP